MEIRKILVGVDTSEESIRALHEAMPIARKNGAEVVLAHVGDVFEAKEDSWLSGDAARHYQELLAARQAEMRDKIAEIRELHLGQGVEISISLLTGFADTAIPKAADEIDADLIVVGSHGRTGVSRFLLGSVAERVVRLTNRDALVARNATSSALYSKIIVPTDFSNAAEASLQAAIELAAPDATITLLHCWSLPPPSAAYGGGIADLRTTIERAGTEQLETLARRYAANAPIQWEIVEGYPAHIIEERSASADLIAMGSHGRRGFRRFILGSVAERTIRHAACSVYVCHSHTKEA